MAERDSSGGALGTLFGARLFQGAVSATPAVLFDGRSTSEKAW